MVEVKISTKGRYALRLLLDLAINETDEYIPIKSIAGRQEISGKYLEQIINQLNKAGFVVSTRGSQGGYKLARHPSEYTVGAILRTMEGNLKFSSCLDEGHSCDRASTCITQGVWKKMQNAVDEVIDNITLENLVDDYYEKAELADFESPFDKSICADPACAEPTTTKRDGAI